MSEAVATTGQAAEAGRRRLLSWANNPLVKAVGRLPAKVRTKLLVGFLSIAALLVVVALLGLRVLGQSNVRAEHLGALQVRIAGYQQLQADAAVLRQELAVCVGNADYQTWLNGGRRSAGLPTTCLRSIRQPVASVLALLGTSTQLGFKPTASEAGSFRKIENDYRRLKGVIARITRSNRASSALHARAEQLAVELEVAARGLAEGTTTKSQALIAENQRSYSHSRNLFIGVAAGAVGLALVLGLLLSWSLVGPLQRIGSRLAAIASGDFSRHVEVSNRDELGTLAMNVNRMNDRLDRLYRELETASKHKSEFLANMSHELRTPLNAIIGFSQVLRERLFGELNEKQEEYIGDILSSSDHLLALINDILDLSKVEAGQVELEIAPFSLREALERGIVMVKERATRNGVEVGLEIDSSVGVVQADERRIRQVVFNLLSNAVKFTPAGGSVEVRSAQVNGEIRVSVVDTGPGIAPDDHERIFEEFQQTTAGTQQAEGTGLGLALSKRLIELHGGQIWVESAVGEGSTFTFTLPAATAAA